MTKAGFPRPWSFAAVNPKKSAFFVSCQPRPGVDHGIRVERHAVDALIHQPFGQIGVIRRALAADADVLAACWQAAMAIASSFFTAGSRSSNRLATRPESRSRPRVSWVRSLEPIEKPSKCFEELVGQQRVGRDLAHHDELAGRPRRAPGRFRPAGRPPPRPSPTVRTKGTMISHVGQAHVVAHPLHGAAFQLEAVAEARRDVARGAAEAEHRVFFLRLVAARRRSGWGIRWT